MPAAPELRDVRREPRAAHVLRRRLARELAEPDRHVAPPCQQQREEEGYLTDKEPQAQAPDGVATGGEHVRVDQREERGGERELEPAERDAPDRRRHDGRRERGGLARATGSEGPGDSTGPAGSVGNSGGQQRRAAQADLVRGGPAARRV